MIGGVRVAAFFGVRVDEPFGVGGFFLGGLQWWPPAVPDVVSLLDNVSGANMVVVSSWSSGSVKCGLVVLVMARGSSMGFSQGFLQCIDDDDERGFVSGGPAVKWL